MPENANLPEVQPGQGVVPAQDTSPSAVDVANDPRPVLLLCGGGPVARSVTILAQSCGFAVDVVDSHPERVETAQYPGARRCMALPGYANLVTSCQIGTKHCVVVATGNERDDYAVLRQILTSHAFYIGMEGDRLKRESIFAALRSEGVPAAELACIRCPVGLPIGARTPEQVAVSTVAELLAAQAGTLQRLRLTA